MKQLKEQKAELQEKEEKIRRRQQRLDRLGQQLEKLKADVAIKRTQLEEHEKVKRDTIFSYTLPLKLDDER